MLTKLACPHCKAVLRSSKAIPTGMQITCIKCKQPFTVTPDMAVGEAQGNSTLPAGELATADNPPVLLSESMAGTMKSPMALSHPGTTRSPMAGSQAGTMKSPMAGSQAGTMKSPMAGSHAGTVKSPLACTPPGAASSPPKEANSSSIQVSDRTPMPDAMMVPKGGFGFGASLGETPLLPLNRPRRKSRTGLIVAILASLVLLAGGGFAAWYFSRETPEPQVDSSEVDKQFANLYPLNKDIPVPPVRAEEKNPPKKEEAPKNLKAVPKKRKLPADNEIKNKPQDPLDTPPPLALAPALSAEHQGKINEAIARGVRYLKDHQTPSGSWVAGTGKHSIGYAALPALALLECQVTAADPVLQKAAAFVRQHSPNLADTYDLGLAVLFLDRLGDPRDKLLIQSLALRLIAGQNAAGGWDYKCPVLTLSETKALLTYLQKNRPQIDFFNPIQGDPKLSTPIRQPGPGNLPEPIQKDQPPATDPLPSPIDGKTDSKDPKDIKIVAPGLKDNPAIKPKTPITKKDKATRSDSLPDNLRDLPIFGNAKIKGKGSLLPSGLDDNSNTQFALLGLWAARRHDVPTELSLELTEIRFQRSQRADGGWGYVVGQPSKNSMTCVGLLGLAMGHGAAAEAMLAASAKGKVPPKASLEDAYIQHGLKTLGQYIDLDGKKGLSARIDLYFLWSMERVAVLYNLKTIGRKDWYAWGAQIVLAGQKTDGHWKDHYSPPVDTSFALLFLQRSNLIKDLTENLNLYLAITDPDAAPGPKKK